MRGAKKRKVVTPTNIQDPNTIIPNHVVNSLNASTAMITEYDVVHKERPKPFCMRDLNIPRWLLITLASVTIVLFTAFAVFASIVTLKKETNGGACKTNSDCRQDLGLLCNNYRCGCAYSHFWSESYFICERQRMINRTCYNNSECDSLGNLQCINVLQSSGNVQAQCQCQAGMSWNGAACSTQGLWDSPCIQNSNCDGTRFLYCDTSSGTGLCNCNGSMFWNGNLISGTCEYRRTINQYCWPYNDNWCDFSGPVGQGLTCAHYVNPYGSEYGLCECATNQFYNGTPSLGNGYCVLLREYGQGCTITSNCDYQVNLTCVNNICTCGSGLNYDPTITNAGGSNGSCVSAYGYLHTCTNTSQCSTSQNLYCDLTYYGATGACVCNSSWSFWDGLTCASKLSIGGQCTSDINCISSSGLFCSNYTQSIGQCDCDKSYYWNSTCTLKQYYNTTCASSYVCDDNRGLQCQGLGGALFSKCDCYNTSFIWDSLYVNNRTNSCILKLSYHQTVCYGDLECQDFNYLKCVNNTCVCVYTDYWDGARCQAKRNYTDPCNTTSQCRDFSPVNLTCILGTSATPILQCLCNSTSYWEACQQACVTSKGLHQPCTLVSNCTSNECDKTANLQCMNDSSSGGAGWCNCTSLQWWNGTYCRNKGTPSWTVNASDRCNASYQCADYNLVSCPLGSSYPQNATCECATTKYWNGFTCLDRVAVGQSCTLWPASPVNTSTCLSAAGEGLLCSSSTCVTGTGLSCTIGTCAAGASCTGGTCYCPTGSSWNTTFAICAVTATGK